MSRRQLVAFFLFAASLFAAEVNLHKPIATLSLKDGRTLANVTLVSYGQTAVMAKWEGGRGTIAYQDFPDEYAAPLAKLKPKTQPATTVAQGTDKQKAPTKATAAKEGKSGLDSILHSDFGVRTLDRGQIIADVGWKVTLVNTSNLPIRVRPSFKMLDGNGYSLGEEQGSAITLRPGATHQVAETTVVKLSIWDQAQSFKLYLSEL